ncbi:MAG: hypothetical protein B7Y33_02640, partial [Hydrogenophilales bacterium 16-62-9]
MRFSDWSLRLKILVLSALLLVSGICGIGAVSWQGWTTQRELARLQEEDAAGVMSLMAASQAGVATQGAIYKALTSTLTGENLQVATQVAAQAKIFETEIASAVAAPEGDADIRHGRYLIATSGCNDCHTPGFMPNAGKVAESEWMTGDSMGWQGPWGTTYPSNLRLLVWFLVGALLCGVIGTLILRAIARPLGEVVKQAEAIGARRFITIEEPRTREFRSVVRAMNALSGQVRGMLDEESVRLEHLRRDAQHDALTGLLNREHFLNKIQYALEGEDAAPTGALFILRLPDLIKLNKELGRETTDTLLKRVASALQESCPDEACLIGRLNGADFAVLAPDVDSVDELAQKIFARTMLSINDPSSPTEHAVWLGAAVYRHGDAVSQVLSRADMALNRAESEGGSAVEMDNAHVEWKPAASLVSTWQELIETALNLNRVQFAIYPVLSGQCALIHYEAPA